MLINIKKLFALTAFTVAVSLLSHTAGNAAANEYSLQQNINVALLRVSSAGQSGSAPTAGSLEAPYIFDILNNRPDIKPPVWRLQNPSAPVTVDAETNSRWNNAYLDNQQVTPNMAAYWELDFNKVESAASLTQYNLLVIRADNLISLTLAQRSLLRQYVDQGGTLWIDSDRSTIINANAAGNLDGSNPFRVEFGANPIGPTAAGTSNVYHPIVTSPFVFSSTAIDSLGYGGLNASSGTGSSCLTLTSALNTSDAPDPTLFTRISNTLIAGDYGSGHVVIDGLGVGDWINLDGGTQTSWQGGWTAGTTYTAGQIVSYNNTLYYCISTNVGQQPGDATTDPYSSTELPYHHQYWTANNDAYDATQYSTASAQDLKFLVNIISYATNSSTGNANLRGNSALISGSSGALATNWQYLNGTTTNPFSPSGIATYGKFIYATDSFGDLSCFDVNPSESIFSDAVNGDDGAIDLSNGSSYDLIWTVPGSGTPLSAPVVAQLPISSSLNEAVVMVEDNAGNVIGYPAVYDPASVPINNAKPTKVFEFGGSNSGTFTGTPPAPTYYRGELIAPEPSSTGTVAVWSVLGQNLSPTTTVAYPTSNSASGFTFPVTADATGAVSWVQPIAAASIPSADGTYYADSVVAYAVTTSGVQSLQLGARDEQLYAQTSNDTTTATNYLTYSGTIEGTKGADVFGAFEDTGNTILPDNWILDYTNSNVFADQAGATSTTSSVLVSAVSDTVYGDYDIIPAANSTPSRILVPAQINNGEGLSNTVAGAAIGPDNVLYMTVNEPAGTTGQAYIEAVNEQNPSDGGTNTPKTTWRFELDGKRASTTVAAAPVTDYQQVSYSFYGDQFVGAPVVGNNGLVYAIANGEELLNGVEQPVIDVLAFNTNPKLGIETGSIAGNSFIYSQTDEFGNKQSVSQLGGAGDIGIGNFAIDLNNTLTTDVYAPDPVIVTPTNGGTTDGAPQTVLMDTSFDGAAPLLAWYTQLVGVTATSAPRLAGDYLYFGTSAPAVAAVYDNPSALGLQPDAGTRQIANTTAGSPQTSGTTPVNFAPDYRFVQEIPIGNPNGGTAGLPGVSIPPVATSKYMVVAGAGSSTQLGGLQGLIYNTILVADGSRLVEFDPNGDATWSLDSTQEAAQNGTAANSTTNALETTDAETSVALNRPSTVTQLTADDYLVADTGNNRCVHIDRQGNVLTQLTDSQGHTLIPRVGSNGTSYALEISSFNDPLGLLPVGQPTTLNRPNSVVTWVTYDYGNSASNAIQAINVHYLIADTGNCRILDIVDRYVSALASGGGSLYELSTPSDFHYLNWISRTSDVGGRLYGYNVAAPVLVSGVSEPTVTFPDDATNSSAHYMTNEAEAVIGSVGDKYIPMLDTSQTSHLTQVDQDAAGSSILLLNYTSGQQYSTTNATGLPVSLINKVYFEPTSTVSPQPTETYPLRGLRSAVAVTYSTSPLSFGQFVIADDDGVFRGVQSATPEYAVGSYPHAATYVLDASFSSGTDGWSFTSADYANMVNLYQEQLDNVDPLTSGALHADFASTPFVPASAIELPGNNFLIVNKGASSNPNAPNQSGSDSGFGGDVFTVHALISSTAEPVDTLDGPIYGKPANTGALSSPAFAIQSN